MRPFCVKSHRAHVEAVPGSSHRISRRSPTGHMVKPYQAAAPRFKTISRLWECVGRNTYLFIYFYTYFCTRINIIRYGSDREKVFISKGSCRIYRIFDTVRL